MSSPPKPSLPHSPNPPSAAPSPPTTAHVTKPLRPKREADLEAMAQDLLRRSETPGRPAGERGRYGVDERSDAEVLFGPYDDEEGGYLPDEVGTLAEESSVLKEEVKVEESKEKAPKQDLEEGEVMDSSAPATRDSAKWPPDEAYETPLRPRHQQYHSQDTQRDTPRARAPPVPITPNPNRTAGAGTYTHRNSGKHRRVASMPEHPTRPEARSDIFAGCSVFILPAAKGMPRLAGHLPDIIKRNGGRLCNDPSKGMCTHILIATDAPGYDTVLPVDTANTEPYATRLNKNERGGWKWSFPEILRYFARAEGAVPKREERIERRVLRQEWVLQCVDEGRYVGSERAYGGHEIKARYETPVATPARTHLTIDQSPQVVAAPLVPPLNRLFTFGGVLPIAFCVVASSFGTGVINFAIKNQGGGALASQARANVIVLPLEKGQVAEDPAHLKIIRDAGQLPTPAADTTAVGNDEDPPKVVVSQDWVMHCIEQQKVLPMDEYLVRAAGGPSAGAAAASEGSSAVRGGSGRKSPHMGQKRRSWEVDETERSIIRRKYEYSANQTYAPSPQAGFAPFVNLDGVAFEDHIPLTRLIGRLRTWSPPTGWLPLLDALDVPRTGPDHREAVRRITRLLRLYSACVERNVGSRLAMSWFHTFWMEHTGELVH
ncbi:hypothetical protein IAT38_005879 [Cryptococcus sp. DSM 104549]